MLSQPQRLNKYRSLREKKKEMNFFSGFRQSRLLMICEAITTRRFFRSKIGRPRQFIFSHTYIRRIKRLFPVLDTGRVAVSNRPTVIYVAATKPTINTSLNFFPPPTSSLLIKFNSSFFAHSQLG